MMFTTASFVSCSGLHRQLTAPLLRKWIVVVFTTAASVSEVDRGGVHYGRLRVETQ